MRKRDAKRSKAQAERASLRAAHVLLIHDGFKAGKGIAQIARENGVDPHRLYRLSRDCDIRNPLGTNPINYLGALGKIRPALDLQSREFLDWFVANQVEGVSPAEFLVSCAVDAFHEEKAKKEAA